MTVPDQQVERLRQAFRALAEDAAPRDDCPPGERLWECLCGELPGEGRRALVDHVAGCPACAELWRLGSELIGDEIVSAEETLRPGAGRVVSWSRWGALAAAIVAVALLAVVAPRILRTEEPAPASFRAGDEEGLRSLVPEDRPLAREAFVLRWSGGVEGSVHEVELARENLEELYRVRGIESAEHRVPPGTLDDIAAGSRLLWRVVAIAPDGTRTASPTFVVVVE